MDLYKGISKLLVLVLDLGDSIHWLMHDAEIILSWGHIHNPMHQDNVQSIGPRLEVVLHFAKPTAESSPTWRWLT